MVSVWRSVTCQNDPIFVGLLGLSFWDSEFITVACGLSLCFGPRYFSQTRTGQTNRASQNPQKKGGKKEVGGEKYC